MIDMGGQMLKIGSIWLLTSFYLQSCQHICFCSLSNNSKKQLGVPAQMWQQYFIYGQMVDAWNTVVMSGLVSLVSNLWSICLVVIFNSFPCVSFIGNIPLLKALRILNLHKYHTFLSLPSIVLGLDLLLNYSIFFNRLLWSISASSTLNLWI